MAASVLVLPQGVIAEIVMATARTMVEIAEATAVAAAASGRVSVARP